MEQATFRCSVCRMPAVLRDGRWEHAEAADAVFCTLVMRGQRPADEEEPGNE